MTNVGHGNALLSPLSTVHVTGSARGLTVTFHPPLPAAGAEPAVADPTDAVAGEFLVGESDGGAADRDRVHYDETKTSSTPHRRADAERSASADPGGWVNHSRPEARSGHAATAASVAPKDRSATRGWQRLADENEVAGDVPGSVPVDHEAERQARLRRWQAIG